MYGENTAKQLLGGVIGSLPVSMDWVIDESKFLIQSPAHEQQSKRGDLFKPFERLGRETGSIGGASTMCEGSTFWIEIPLFESPPRPQTTSF